MRIAFTHNLQRSPSEAEAEFDTPQTVAFISNALRNLGHEVDAIDVSGPLAQTLARLEARRPQLVFNTAEGHHGRYREAFYPGLFEQLGIPYTGSDAYVCAVTLDKRLSKQLALARGVPTPKWAFVDRVSQLTGLKLRFPLIVKPNFEGSSKGVTQKSVVANARQLAARVKAQLKRYPEGLLVEEFIAGRDVAVPFIAKASRATRGVLPAAEYEYDVPRGAHRIYDFALKQLHSERVQVRVPARLPKKLAQELVKMAQLAIDALGLRDLGRLDFRLSDEGALYFIEANALPSLEQGAAIYESARRVGLRKPEQLLAAVIDSALERAPRARRSSSRRPLRVGLTFNLKRVKPSPDGAHDEEAEYDSRETIDALHAAIASHGHQVVELEATAALPASLAASQVDVVFNLAEGQGGRGREAAVPAMLELLGIPYTGSDAASLCLCLDKVLAKRLVRDAGVPIADYVQIQSDSDTLPKSLRYPLVVKPVAEGSSKGVLARSVARNPAELRRLVRDTLRRYRQPALVEEYLPGREFTVAVLGQRVLPAMEIVFTKAAGKHPLYTLEHKLAWVDAVRYQAPAKVSPALGRELERAARCVFGTLGCRDLARIDFRLDARGRPCFIECNPLPGLSPGWSDLCLIAEAAGISYHRLVGDILEPALRRFRQASARRGKRLEYAP